MDVNRLALRKVMLHSVARATKTTKDKHPPGLTDLPVALTPVVKEFLEGKIRATLASKARPVTEDLTLASPSAKEVRGYLQADATERDLVSTSKEIASRLHEAQPGISPNGMVLIADVELAGDDALVVAKLDIETGVRASTQVVDGQNQATIEIVPDLFVTDQTKVFKVAIFPSSGVQGDALHGQMVDAQIDGAGVAGYFLTFLGCGLSQRPQEVTERFFDATQNFLNSGAVTDPEVRAKIELGLIAEIGNEGRQINPALFAANNVPVKVRDAYIAALRENSVSTPFAKNIELVESRLKRVQIETDSGVLVLAPPEKLADGTVEVSGEGNGSVSIKDGIKRVSGRGGR
ncbi:MAG: nucleoid-associated protein [Mycobacteriales bacterium]